MLIYPCKTFRAQRVSEKTKSGVKSWEMSIGDTLCVAYGAMVVE